jgi:antitoxin (DNA-binding transcriptional repressor) of toxin-antitoxin stability system
MSERISIDDFPPHIRERLERAVNDAETITVMNNDRPVAEIRPVRTRVHTPESLAQLFESLPHLTPEEAEDFGRDLEEIRKSAGNLPTTDPWDS